MGFITEFLADIGLAGASNIISAIVIFIICLIAIKVITTVAALENLPGVTETTFECKGGLEVTSASSVQTIHDFGRTSHGTMTLKQVYTRFYEVLEQAKNGIDKRCTITTALKDPDAADGMEERYSVNNVAFTELPFIGYKMGEVNQQKLPFTFRPSDLQCLDRIQTAD